MYDAAAAEIALDEAAVRLSQGDVAWRAEGKKMELSPDVLQPDCLVYPFILCPPLPSGTRFFLVERKPWGERAVLSFDCATSQHLSVNLARLRLNGARLGANEVHLLPKANGADAIAAAADH